MQPCHLPCLPSPPCRLWPDEATVYLVHFYSNTHTFMGMSLIEVNGTDFWIDMPRIALCMPS